MAISDKTRKILWGRSGNRCAICRRELVLDATTSDDESVVGEECHIVSGKVDGPRYDPAFPPERLDEYENLILLCRIHHKMIDDQCATYTAEMVRDRKATHETWVSSNLSERKPVPPVRIRRIKENLPSRLIRLTTGQEIAVMIGGALGFSYQHDEPKSQAEAELIAGFLQEVQDWADLWPDFDAGNHVKIRYRVGNLVRELEEAGFWVFGARELQRLEGGIGPPSDFSVAIIRVVRTTNLDAIHPSPQQPVEMETETERSDVRNGSQTGDA